MKITELSSCSFRTRRTAIKRLAFSWLSLFASRQAFNANANSNDRAIQDAHQRMKTAREEEARDVERLYSTKPVRVILGARKFVIPANFFSAKEKNGLTFLDATKDGFGFAMFLPNYEGYTKENWRDPFDRRLVKVLRVSLVDKNAMVPLIDGGSERIKPEGYGEPHARFRNLKALLEHTPSFDMYGLKGYRRKGGGDREITWTAVRSNGEFFFIHSSFAPGESVPRGLVNAFCHTRYYSEAEDLFVAYMYSQDHIARWRDIDDAVWTKLHQWQER